MSGKKKCKRKVWPLVNPVLHAIEGVSKVDAPTLDKVRIKELTAIQALLMAAPDSKSGTSYAAWSI